MPRQLLKKPMYIFSRLSNPIRPNPYRRPPCLSGGLGERSRFVRCLPVARSGLELDTNQKLEINAHYPR
ncbi:MAG TPA: hypothetical protein VE944_11165 [Nostoc sp.]|nr:hypothetical protein [Nostoc sp.]